jgi:hypothetical protein
MYWSCCRSVLLFHCIQLLNSGWSAIPIKCVNNSVFIHLWFFQMTNVFSCWIRISRSNRYTNLVLARSLDLNPPDFYLWGAANCAVYRDRPRTLNEFKTAIPVYISHTQICRKCLRITSNGFRPESRLADITSNTFYKCIATFRTPCRW